MVGLLTDKSQIRTISTELQPAGADVAAVEILCGEQGARILDEDGRYRGPRDDVVRTIQRLGCDGTTLAIYDEAPRDGDLLRRARLTVAASRRCSSATVSTMWATSASHVRAVPHPQYGLTPIRPQNSWPLGEPVRPGPRAVAAECPSGGHPRDSRSVTA